MFIQTIHSLNDGKLVQELDQHLAELVHGVKTIGKPGSITIKINITPQSRECSEVVFVAEKIDVSMPEFDRRKTIFFVDDDDRLVRSDPRQTRMFEGEKP